MSTEPTLVNEDPVPPTDPFVINTLPESDYPSMSATMRMDQMYIIDDNDIARRTVVPSYDFLTTRLSGKKIAYTKPDNPTIGELYDALKTVFGKFGGIQS